MTVLSDLSVKISADVGGYTTGIQRAERAQAGFSTSVSMAAQNLRQFGQVGFQAMSVMDRFQISNLSVQNATTSAANAQIRYNQTLNDFGEGSQQAILALNQLDQANRQVESANTQAKLSFATMGLAMIGMVPQIISFATTTIVSFTAATASVEAFGAAVWAAAPYVAIIGVAIAGLYYLWNKNEAEVKKNVDAMAQYSGVLRETTTDAKELRAAVEKPVLRPSLMDIYNENVTGNAGVGFGRRTEEEKKTYANWSQTLGFGASPQTSLEAVAPIQAPQISYEDRLRSAGYGWAMTPPPDMNPSPGMPYAPRVGGSSLNPNDVANGFDKSSAGAAIIKSTEQPRQMTIIQNVTVNTGDDPFELGKQLAKGAAAGIDQTNFHYAGRG